ncbi:MAG: hypothetical protein HQM16_18735, partial [Deltaproteobacteria bacterium]|nr:hypothetical protein [Deltaproteobacteria bacterium]
TKEGAEVVLDKTTTNSFGEFEFTVSHDNPIITIRVMGGSYVDPITNKPVAVGTNELSAIIDIKDNEDKDTRLMTVSLMTTLFTAFVESVDTNTALNTDPYLYARDVFKNIFLFDPTLDLNRHLLSTAPATKENNLLTLYDLAFVKMAHDVNAGSAINLVSAFAESLNETCSLLPYTPVKSGSYTLNADSFVQDYLESLSEIANLALAVPYTDNVDIADTVGHILESNHFILGYNDVL